VIIAGDILQVVFNAVLPDGEQAKNVFYVRMDDLGGVTQVTALGQIRDYIDDIYDALGNNVSDTFLAGIMDIYRRNTATDQWDREGGRASNYASTNPGEPCSNQQTGVVYALTDNSRVTSRKSFASLVSAELETNTWSVTAQNALAAAATNWINPPNDQDIILTAGCFSKKLLTFVPFNGVGEARALEGSMDTRKP